MPAATPATDARILKMRAWIAAADARGTPRSEMQLQLSGSDISGLKRSSRVRTDEITFVQGVMRFLDVEVVPAATSSLATPAPTSAEPPAESAA